MRFAKSKEEESGIIITPLIDIVFLLLIFFMLTSHFHIASGLPIRLPKVADKAYEWEGQKIVLVIDRSGHTYLRGERIELEKLGRKLQNLAETGGLVHLILEADKDVTHGRVVQIMDLAKTAGVRSIIIAARWEPRKVF